MFLCHGTKWNISIPLNLSHPGWDAKATYLYNGQRDAVRTKGVA